MDEVINPELVKYSCACICCASAFIFFILLVSGFSSLEATEFGLNYSWMFKTISPEVEENGIHFLGVGHSFIRFPKTVQTIEFSYERTANRGPISSRTSDGLEVTLEISFQYILQPENIYKLYCKYGKNYPQIFQNIAIHLLTEEATKYTAYNFFMDRGIIKDDFQKNLNEYFNKVLFSNIVFLQLRNVDLPELFEESIQESEVKKQDIQRALAEYNKMSIEVETKIKSAEYQKEIMIIKAKGDAIGMLNQNEANCESLRKINDAQIQGYKKFKQNIGLNNNELFKYMETNIIKDNKKDVILYLNQNDI
jgi:regulator of protease activity HflC (stomatin/prohibitin superfamily)